MRTERRRLVDLRRWTSSRPDPISVEQLLRRCPRSRLGRSCTIVNFWGVTVTVMSAAISACAGLAAPRRRCASASCSASSESRGDLVDLVGVNPASSRKRRASADRATRRTRRGTRRWRRACRRRLELERRPAALGVLVAVSRRSQSEPIFTWVTSSASIQSSQNSSTGSPAMSPNSFIVVNTSMARPSRARFTPVRRSTGSGLHAASYRNVFSANSPISEPIHRRASPRSRRGGPRPSTAGPCRASARTAPSSAPASPVAKSQQVRPAPSSAWISPTKMPCISARAASGASGRAGREPSSCRLGFGRRCGHGTGVVDALAHRDGRSASSRASSSTGNEPPHQLRLHGLTDAADRARAGDAAGGQHQLLELGLVARRPLDLFGGLDERLDQHLAVAPVLELVLQGELQRADRGRVGDRDVLFRWYV